MNSHEINSRLKRLSLCTDEWDNVSVEGMLKRISVASAFTLDDVLALKKIHMNIEGRLDMSISGFIRKIVDSKEVRFNEAEIQALSKINNIFDNPYRRLMSHEFIVLESLSRSLKDSNGKKRDISFKEEIKSYTTSKEIDIVLCNNNSRTYYSYLTLTTSLFLSIYSAMI